MLSLKPYSSRLQLPIHQLLVATKKNKNSTVAAEKKIFMFNEYIYKVLEQEHPDIAIFVGAMDMMNIMISNVMMKLIHESSNVTSSKKLTMMTAKEMNAAVKGVFPEEMAKLSPLQPVTSFGIDQLCNTIDKTVI
ncbi:putative transcription factor Hap3/NF-YB family [Medicago truncatula]|uniref:Histone H2B, putative n=1 Tax=Medicago truncatula TaxID=3880 RepID=A0A072UHN7_MEDTR|nr:histone H2B, putative [Medicago truncatula]RHN59540.1 putative transcription factor Hap3/NF-YB family [Medicago truncatula]